MFWVSSKAILKTLSLSEMTFQIGIVLSSLLQSPWRGGELKRTAITQYRRKRATSYRLCDFNLTSRRRRASMVMTIFPHRGMHDESDPGAGRRSQWLGADRLRVFGGERTPLRPDAQVQVYSRMLFQFFDALGKTPDEVSSPDVFSYAHSIGLSARKPSSVTIATRSLSQFSSG